ncbi:glycosyltransferase [Photorhabdus stackebrandtii]|uniref:UDP-glucose--(Glucosyl)LPS alpha-1,2-glucosyltransferase n=1 Tax=Photorhabdus stackebrandtii TaxID=1123042 RepID=A0A7X5TMX2_9GAMM|nr:glycosyltransferase [Photorhabdus stackebrandtii]NHB97969.1 UDP-glucose--(glucosyl)LPS alpha-1,2-glucosyltransferase [Photorhabdus stackebrandtii]
MKRIIFVAPEFHSIPPTYSAAVEWWIYNVAKKSNVKNIIICKGERNERKIEIINETSTIYRVHISSIYKRVFKKWTGLDPFPYSKRIASKAYQISKKSDSILIVHNSIRLYNEIKEYYPEELMILHMHNKQNTEHLDFKTKLITPSVFLADFFKKEVPGINVKVVPNGISKSMYDSSECWNRGKFNLQDKDTIILYAGRLDKGKGVLELMESITILKNTIKNIKLLIVGDYENKKKGDREYYRKKVIEQAKKMNSFCILAGNISPKNMHKIYPLANLTVIPSLADEAFCMVALESMASGTPVLVSPRGGIKEFVIHNKTGFHLKEPLSVESISLDINETLNDPNMKIIANQAKLIALNSYDWENISNKLLDVLNEWL